MNAKMGRPRTSNPNEKNLTVRINAELDSRLQEYCSQNNVSKGEVVRKGIEKVLGEKEK